MTATHAECLAAVLSAVTSCTRTTLAMRQTPFTTLAWSHPCSSLAGGTQGGRGGRGDGGPRGRGSRGGRARGGGGGGGPPGFGGGRGAAGGGGAQPPQQQQANGAPRGAAPARPPAPVPVPVPTEDFDFEAALAKFEKADINKVRSDLQADVLSLPDHVVAPKQHMACNIAFAVPTPAQFVYSHVTIQPQHRRMRT